MIVAQEPSCAANLPDHIFVIEGEAYYQQITSGEYIKAGCQNHAAEQWRSFTRRKIAEMDGRKALKFSPRLLDVIDFNLGKGKRPEGDSLKGNVNQWYNRIDKHESGGTLATRQVWGY